MFLASNVTLTSATGNVSLDASHGKIILSSSQSLLTLSSDILLSSGGGSFLSMQGQQGNTVLESSNDISMTGGGLVQIIATKSNVRISASNDILLTSSKSLLTLSSNVLLSSGGGGSLDLESSSDLSIKGRGNTVILESSNDISMTGGGLVQISSTSSNVQVSASNGILLTSASNICVESSEIYISACNVSFRDMQLRVGWQTLLDASSSFMPQGYVYFGDPPPLPAPGTVLMHTSESCNVSSSSAYEVLLPVVSAAPSVRYVAAAGILESDDVCSSAWRFWQNLSDSNVVRICPPRSIRDVLIAGPVLAGDLITLGGATTSNVLLASAVAIAGSDGSNGSVRSLVF